MKRGGKAPRSEGKALQFRSEHSWEGWASTRRGESPEKRWAFPRSSLLRNVHDAPPVNADHTFSAARQRSVCAVA